MMKGLDDFLSDDRGMSSMAFRLVLAVTIAAAVMIILLQLMHVNKDTLENSTQTVDSGATKALDDSMRYITD